MLGEYDFTCLSLKSQAVEKKKRDEMPLGKAPRGREGDEERARGRLSSSRTWWVTVTDFHYPSGSSFI